MNMYHLCIITGISKASKRALWVIVADLPVPSSNGTQPYWKKNGNLQRDSRNAYMDYQMEISLTGTNTLNIKLIVYKF